ncbi:MAG: hypothetical protein ABSB76_08315 [Streptosporangiaceae bacterium]
MSDDSIRFPAPRAVPEDGAGDGAGDGAAGGAASPYLLLGMVRRLRARERGYLAGLLHDGPIQELAAAPLELAEARRATGTAQRDELGVVAQQVDAASRSLRGMQDELWPFPQPSCGLAAALKQRTGWLLDIPLAVDAGPDVAGLAEADIQVVADIVELILAGLVSTAAPVPARPLAAVQAGQDLIFLQLNMTAAPDGDLAFGGPAARASLRSLAAAVQARADLDLHGRRLRVRMDIPRWPRQSGLTAVVGPGYSGKSY